MLKCDLTDGYYRLGLVINDIPKIAVTFPSSQKQKLLIALPLVLPMGWKNSGPDFCAATETITNMANNDIRKNVHHLPHQLDELAQTIDHKSKPEVTTSQKH